MIQLFFLFVWGWTKAALACSVLAIPQSASKVVGKNYVWPYEHGRLFFNRTHMHKRGLVQPDSSLKPLAWTSRYPSLTFNQIAENFPNGGINSRGLVVEILLSAADFPKTTRRPAINELQWIQYLLDSAGTLEQAIAAAKLTDIVPLGGHLFHYFVCDRETGCAVFEYVKGKLTVFGKDEEGKYPLGVTNANFSDQYSHSRGLRYLTGKSWINDLGEDFQRQEHPDAAAEVLDLFSVMGRMNPLPAWQIVYERKSPKVHFRIRGIGKRLFTRSIAMNAFTLASDFDCRSAIWVEGTSKRRYVRPALSFDLQNPARHHDSESLNRIDFKPDSSSELVEESEEMLWAATISDSLRKALRSYQVTHTGCRLRN